MKIIQLTPGTGSFYCGTCLRDNALVSALRRQGHDALMVPLYLDPALDEVAASEGAPIFYGGINVYLQQKSGFFRKTPRFVDALFDSATALKSAAKRAGMTDPSELGDLTLSTLKGEDGNQSKELERLVQWLTTEIKPDVVCLSNALLLGLARRIKEQTGAKVYCTLQGEDYFLDLLKEPSRSECWRVLGERGQEVDGFIAVSHYYAEVMTRRASLPKEKVSVVYNGISLEGYPSMPRATLPDPPVIGFLSRMCDLKGLGTLVDAFILLRQKPGRERVKLHIAGAQTEGDLPYLEREVEDKLKVANLWGDCTLSPNISREEKIAFLKSISVLSVPALYGEAFGLYLIEAMAAGVPVVQPDHAAFPEVLQKTGGGLLFEGTGAQTLADALDSLLSKPEQILELGKAGHHAVHSHFSVERMAEEVTKVFST